MADALDPKLQKVLDKELQDTLNRNELISTRVCSSLESQVCIAELFAFGDLSANTVMPFCLLTEPYHFDWTCLVLGVAPWPASARSSKARCASQSPLPIGDL